MRSIPTETETELLAAIRVLSKSEGMAPTLSELARLTELKKPTVQAALRRLRQRGLVSWQSHQARTLKVVEVPRRAVIKRNKMQEINDRLTWLEARLDAAGL